MHLFDLHIDTIVPVLLHWREITCRGNMINIDNLLIDLLM